MNQQRVIAEVCPQPAFLTGTSTEYIGDRARPRVLRERPVVFVLGPKGCGKSTVARALADGAVVLDNRACQGAILDRVRNAEWSVEMATTPALVLDGPVWLHNRPGALQMLTELLTQRTAAGLRTVVCQADTEASVCLLLDLVPAGTSALIALRFPRSPKARRRVAEKICAAQGAPRSRAFGTAGLPDWSYAGVASAIRR